MTAKKRRLPRTVWQKGTSGNPRGRPPLGSSIAEGLRTVLAEEHRDGMTNREAILRKVIAEAIAGRPWAVEFVTERTEGRVTQLQEIKVDNGLGELQEIFAGMSNEELDKIIADARAHVEQWRHLEKSDPTVAKVFGALGIATPEPMMEQT